jgi:hypothetical protein
MKKVLKVLTAAMLAAVVAASAATCAFAAEENKINENEQRVLTELKGKVNMGGVQKPLKAQWLTVAEKSFTEIDMTKDQADKVIAKIQELKTYLESLNKKTIDEMTDAEVDKAVGIGKEAAQIVGITLTYDKSSRLAGYTIAGSNASQTSKATQTGDVVKVTGLDVPGVAPVAGVAVLAVAAAGIYVISTSKKKETVGA